MPDQPVSDSAFVALPQRHDGLLRVLGPKPAEAGSAVDPLVKIDQSLTVVQAFIGALCRDDGRLVQPVEIVLPVSAATVTPNKQVPASAVVRALAALPDAIEKLPAVPGFELLQQAVVANRWVGPLLYCRKRHVIFEARSPNTAERLTWAGKAVPAGTGDIPVELLVWDGPATGRDVSIYGSRGGRSALGVVLPFEQMILDQGKVAARHAELASRDPAAAATLAQEHTCCTCPERPRCYPGGDNYAYAADRLVTVGALDAPAIVRPLGEWRLNQAARIIGGSLASEASADATRENEFTAWRAARALAIDQGGPARLLTGENDGRELLELTRVKLALIADVLAQLDDGWRAVGRPHLAWNDETVRCAWQPPGRLPAAAWGFRPILRKCGLHPVAPVQTIDKRPTPYPPAFSEPTLLPVEAVDAARYFDEPRPATLFVKKAKAESGSAHAIVLLENLGVTWELFCTADTLAVKGAGWQALLSPLAEREKNDGAGLPFGGTVTGALDKFKSGEQFDKCECRWLPRFGEAVDLHAVGQLGLETLFLHDGWKADAYRDGSRKERDELHKLLRGLPLEQREGAARRFIGERCEVDAPNALWSRRNLLYRADERKATRLDAFPTALWQAIVTVFVRMTTNVAGFSYSADRASDAPRLAAGLLLPLWEVRGLIALLDDLLFNRATPAGALRDLISPKKASSDDE